MTVRHPLQQGRLTPAPIAHPVPVRGLLWRWTAAIGVGSSNRRW